MMRQQQVAVSYCTALWESLSNSWYFYKVAASIRAETSVFHIFRLFHNTFLPSIYFCVHFLYQCICVFCLSVVLIYNRRSKLVFFKSSTLQMHIKRKMWLPSVFYKAFHKCHLCKWTTKCNLSIYKNILRIFYH